MRNILIVVATGLMALALTASDCLALNNAFLGVSVGASALVDTGSEISMDYRAPNDLAFNYGATAKYFMKYFGVGATYTFTTFSRKETVSTNLSHRLSNVMLDAYIPFNDNIMSGIPYGIVFYGRLRDTLTIDTWTESQDFNVGGAGFGYLLSGSEKLAIGAEVRYIHTPTVMQAKDILYTSLMLGYRF